jgi:peptidyl-Lys metalloendopeptidase
MKHMPVKKLLWLVSFSVLITLTGCSLIKPKDEIRSTAEKATLFISMEMRNIQYQKSDKLTIRFTFRNTTKEAVKLLKWNTPLEGFASNFLDITHNGEKVPYIGKLVRRGEITERDFVTLKPSEKRTVTLDLEKGYAIRKPGKYQIYYSPKKPYITNKTLQKFDRKVFLSTDLIQLNRVVIYLKTSLNPCKTKKMLPPDGWDDSFPDDPYNCNGGGNGGATTADYLNCSTSQESTAAAALIRSRPVAAESHNAMLNGPSPSMRPSSPRYTTWYGHYSLPNWDHVTNTFSNMTNTLENRRISFSCNCNENWFAYVHANRPYIIWLCNLFWTTTNDERVVTVIHEASHWNVVGSTNDYAYGVEDSQALADDDPSKAVDNAENYGYFALNNPPLSMFWTDPRDHCNATEDCPTGQVCRNNICVNSNLCANSSQCPGNMLCVSNRCVPRGTECLRIIDCPSGQYCIDNSCVSLPFECRRDEQCGDSAFCINNLCMEF